MRNRTAVLLIRLAGAHTTVREAHDAASSRLTQRRAPDSTARPHPPARPGVRYLLRGDQHRRHLRPARVWRAATERWQLSCVWRRRRRHAHRPCHVRAGVWPAGSDHPISLNHPPNLPQRHRGIRTRGIRTPSSDPNVAPRSQRPHPDPNVASRSQRRTPIPTSHQDASRRAARDRPSIRLADPWSARWPPRPPPVHSRWWGQARRAAGSGRVVDVSADGTLLDGV